MWPDGKTIVPDKGSIFTIDGPGEDAAWSTTRATLTPRAGTFKIDAVSGHYVVFAPPDFIQCPMRAEFEGLDDAVVLSFKVKAEHIYLNVIPLPKLIEWVPPAKATDEVSETGLISVYKLRRAS